MSLLRGSSHLKMDSNARPKPKTTAKNHTPLCPRDCDLSHHDLVVALFMDGRCLSAKIQRLGELPTALKERIETAKKEGWDQDSEIPDPLEEMRNPLLLLACAFGKTGIVEGLLRNNFYPRAVNKHGETALHFLAMYLNKAAAIIGGKLTLHKDREATFERLLHILTDHHPKMLAAKDNFGRTALHVSAENILKRSRIDKRKNVSFDQFCLRSMIIRLLELEDEAIFTRAEITEVIKTAEISNGDSILHILAQDSPAGFEVLKFVQDVLFPGKAMPREKNKKNETVLSLAWETDPRNAVKIFSIGPQESSTHSTTHLHEEETLISNDKGVSTEVQNADVMEPESNFDVDEENTYHATGQAQLLEDDSVPYITEVFSLSNENCLGCEETYDSNKLKDLITPGRVKDESCSEVIPTSLSNVKTWCDADDSFLKFVITEGVALDALAKQNIVEVVLKQYSDKLSQVEDRLPKLGQLMSEEEMALSQKKGELALLKQEIVAKERSLEELKKKRELLCEERKKLKRKVAHCHATEQLLEIKSKKCRSV